MMVLGALAEIHASWFRYSCYGIENIPRQGPALLVGYHGRPAWDAIILVCRLWADGRRVVRGVTHRVMFERRATARVFEALGWYGGDEGTTQEIVARGDLIGLMPGGTHECFRGSDVLYRVDWAGRRGYVRTAQRHDLPIIPFAASGVDEIYRILGGGLAWSRRFWRTDLLPLLVPLGLGGVPLGLPRRVTIRQLVGPPLRVKGLPEEEADARVRAAVQELLDRARAGAGPPPSWERT
jgi:1-acyl-sn-glycerol-3-phosphate acyltransferase